jgi:predicted DCC family thiol-disulfide oxidoreductase YuxK
VFDLVHARRLLYVVSNEELAFSEMTRVAKSGAKLMLYNSNCIKCVFYNLRWLMRKDKPYRHTKIYTKQSIANLAFKHGLAKIKTSSEKTRGRKLSDVKLEAYKQ